MVKEKRNVWINKYSLMFYASALLVVLSWFVFNWPKTIRIVAAILFLVTNVLFNTKNKEATPSLFSRFVNWLWFFIMLSFTISYIALSVGDITIAVRLLHATFLIILVGGVVIKLVGIFRSESLLRMVLSYAVLSFNIIVLFGYGFSLLSGLEGQHVAWADSNIEVESAWNYVYFSSSVYYSNLVGDILPLGYSKFLMQFESAVSYIFHIIIIGFIISNMGKRKKR